MDWWMAFKVALCYYLAFRFGAIDTPVAEADAAELPFAIEQGSTFTPVHNGRLVPTNAGWLMQPGPVAGLYFCHGDGSVTRYRVVPKK